MSKSSKRKRAGRWFKRKHQLELAPSGRLLVNDWDDPSLVKQEISRIDDHIAERELRLAHYAKEIDDLTKLLAEAPARIEKLRELTAADLKKRDALFEQKVRTQLRLGGAQAKARAAALRLKIKRAEEELADLDAGVVRPTPIKATKTGQYESGLGDPEIGAVAAQERPDPKAPKEKKAPGFAGVDPREAADVLREKLATRK